MWCRHTLEPWREPSVATNRNRDRIAAFDVNLELPSAIPILFDDVETSMGSVEVLVMCHCESVDSDILNTTVESFDRCFAINARATWILIREYALRCQAEFGTGPILAMTSDATVGNMPYGARKCTIDRITLAAARELSHLGVTASVINPGPTDTGWMDDKLKAVIREDTPLGRLGLPDDAANLVSSCVLPMANGSMVSCSTRTAARTAHDEVRLAGSECRCRAGQTVWTASHHPNISHFVHLRVNRGTLCCQARMTTSSVVGPTLGGL
jgi:NAD(P)-dependent dehydrogenase (short-subunit alcohol dehydrogenase family)